jgi:hypothetical protein
MTDMHVGQRCLKKKVGAWIRKPVSIWCDHHLCHAAQHLLRIEFIRLLTVAYGMMSLSSAMVVWSCWILAGTGTHCRTRWSRASQTCSMGDMYCIQAMEDLGHVQLPEIVFRSLQQGAVDYHNESTPHCPFPHGQKEHLCENAVHWLQPPCSIPQCTQSSSLK